MSISKGVTQADSSPEEPALSEVEEILHRDGQMHVRFTPDASQAQHDAFH